MTLRSRGLFARKTRVLARHHKPSKLPVSSFIKDFSIGDKVAIVPKGNWRDVPHPRYRGRIGKILEKRGKAYVVEVRIMDAKRKLVVSPLHLERI
jgi:large subunit ribosomal protein L21e